MTMSFVQTNWMLILVLLLSGGMLLWPLVQRRLSPARDVNNLAATQLVNGSNAVLLDVREPAEFGGGHLPKAINVPVGQIASRGPELEQARRAARHRLLRARRPQPSRHRRADQAGLQGRLQPLRRLPRVEGRRACPWSE